MLYYSFGSKEHLFICLLEHIYEPFNKAESKLKLDLNAPVVRRSRWRTTAG